MTYSGESKWPAPAERMRDIVSHTSAISSEGLDATAPSAPAAENPEDGASGRRPRAPGRGGGRGGGETAGYGRRKVGDAATNPPPTASGLPPPPKLRPAAALDSSSTFWTIYTHNNDQSRHGNSCVTPTTDLFTSLKLSVLYGQNHI